MWRCSTGSSACSATWPSCTSSRGAAQAASATTIRRCRPTASTTSSTGNSCWRQMDAFWRNFCRAAGRADLIDDARLGTVAGRFEHYEEVERIVSEVLRTKPLAEWQRLL